MTNDIIYPPTEAVVDQLCTIRAIIAPTIKMYEATQDASVIQVNLDMIQGAIDYLRGTPKKDDLTPNDKEPLKINITPPGPGYIITHQYNKKDKAHDVVIEGLDAEKVVPDLELFGDMSDKAVTQMNLSFPVICGKTYRVVQDNDLLEYFKDDPSISYDEETLSWIKNKDYYMDRDEFEYAFLVTEGRNFITLTVSDTENPEEKEYIFIRTHIHFKEKEETNE